MARFTFQQEFQILKDVSLGAMSIFTSLLAIVATARLIPQDFEDRTVYTILAKPVPRFEYLLGKLAGVLLLIAIGIVAMGALFFLVLYAREHTVMRETVRQMANAPPEQLTTALRDLRAAAFHPDLLSVIGIIYAKACLLAALTLLVSTFATSNLFTIVVMVFIYFIGHLQAIAREYWMQEHAAGWMTQFFLAAVALISRIYRRLTWWMTLSPAPCSPSRCSSRLRAWAFSTRRSMRCLPPSCSTVGNYDEPNDPNRTAPTVVRGCRGAGYRPD